MNTIHITLMMCMIGVASARWAEAYDDGSWKGEGLAESMDHGGWGGGDDFAEAQDYGSSYTSDYHEPAPLGDDGQVVDTPEVAEAKEQHLAAHEAALFGDYRPAALTAWGRQAPAQAAPRYASRPSQNAAYTNDDEGSSRWLGPYAEVELTHDGQYLKDTPEVAHAKELHFDAHREASQRDPYSIYRPAYDYNGY